MTDHEFTPAPGKSLIVEVERLRAEVAAMREALLKLVEVLQTPSKPTITEGAAP
jgi:hypothetical protein